jgi:hypothetical protein
MANPRVRLRRKKYLTSCLKRTVRLSMDQGRVNAGSFWWSLDLPQVRLNDESVLPLVLLQSSIHQDCDAISQLDMATQTREHAEKQAIRMRYERDLRYRKQLQKCESDVEILLEEVPPPPPPHFIFGILQLF